MNLKHLTLALALASLPSLSFATQVLTTLPITHSLATFEGGRLLNSSAQPRPTCRPVASRRISAAVVAPAWTRLRNRPMR